MLKGTDDMTKTTMVDWFFGITDGLDPETQIAAQVSLAFGAFVLFLIGMGVAGTIRKKIIRWLKIGNTKNVNWNQLRSKNLDHKIDVKQLRGAQQKQAIDWQEMRRERRDGTSHGAPIDAPQLALKKVTEEIPQPAIWPWPQTQHLSPSQRRKYLHEALECSRAGDIEGATSKFELLAASLGDDIDLVFHISLLLTKLNRTDEMQILLSNAQIHAPENEHVQLAIQNLGLSNS